MLTFFGLVLILFFRLKSLKNLVVKLFKIMQFLELAELLAPVKGSKMYLQKTSLMHQIAIKDWT